MQIPPQLSVPFVAGCSKILSVQERLFKVSESIYLERPIGKTYVIKSGYVQLVYIQPDGKLWIRMLFGKGALLGDIPFQPGFYLKDERAVASGPVSLLEIDREAFENSAKRDSDFQLQLLKTMASQLQFVDRRMQWQLISPLRTRIAMALSDLMCFAAGKCGHGHLVDVRLTHEEFSQFVVAARPVVSEVLKEFKSAGIIDYTRSHLCLLNLEDLQSIAGTIHR